jgi:hypothetical protein
MTKSLTPLKTTTAVAARRIVRIRIADIGKTTFASHAAPLLFVHTEDGLGHRRKSQRPKKNAPGERQRTPAQSKAIVVHVRCGESRRVARAHRTKRGLLGKMTRSIAT